MKKIALIAATAALIPGAALAQCFPDSLAADTPTERYVDNLDGTITDASTGLMWDKCSTGQDYDVDNNVCIGQPSFVSWQESLQAAAQANADEYRLHADWRVPNIKELGSIVEHQCFEPTLNIDVFGATPSAPYWSSTPDNRDAVDRTHEARFINFRDGLELDPVAGPSLHLRLVRSAGQ